MKYHQVEILIELYKKFGKNNFTYNSLDDSIKEKFHPTILGSLLKSKIIYVTNTDRPREYRIADRVLKICIEVDSDLFGNMYRFAKLK